MLAKPRAIIVTTMIVSIKFTSLLTRELVNNLLAPSAPVYIYRYEAQTIAVPSHCAAMSVPTHRKTCLRFRERKFNSGEGVGSSLTRAQGPTRGKKMYPMSTMLDSYSTIPAFETHTLLTQ
jgi:hypothetical protein